MKLKTTLILIFLITIFIILLNNSKALPCDSLNENECINEYQEGYQESPNCNSLYYCYPNYKNNTFQSCLTKTRTNFSDCENSLSTCYNNIAVDPDQKRKCFCDDGIEFKKINDCGITTDWSGQCIDIKSCKEHSRIYLGKTIKYYTCDILNESKTLDCSNLINIENKCKNDTLLIKYQFYYKSNSCGTKCIIDKIETENINCPCYNGKCYNKKTIMKKELINKTSIKEKIINQTKKLNNIPKINLNYSTNIKIKKSSIQTITIILGFLALLLTGAIFLIKTN